MHDGNLSHTPGGAWRRLCAVLVAWAGVLLSLLLVFRPAGQFCEKIIAAGNCDAVTHSSYAKVAGVVPLSWIGLTTWLALFVGLVAWFFIRLEIPRRWLVRALRAAVGFGALVSLGLIGVQAFKLHAFCPLCLGSALCFFLLASLLFLPGAKGCWQNEANAHSTSAVLPAALALTTLGTAAVLSAALLSNAEVGPKVLATIDGRAVTEHDLPLPVRLAIYPREEIAAKLRRDWLESRIDELLLADEAKRRGTTPEKLRAQTTAAQGDYLARLRAQHSVEIRVRPPIPPIVRFDLPALAAVGQLDGSADAPAVFVVFSDFECPACRQLAPQLRAVRLALGERVAVGFKNLPLEEVHPRARPGALAAMAAAEQGKFWEYHDALMSREPLPGDQAEFIELARALGLDVYRFAESFSAPRATARLAADVKEADALGLDGTPVLFLNGRRIVGMRSTDELLELARSAAEKRAPSATDR